MTFPFPFIGDAPQGGNDAFTKLLLHCDGIDGSKTLIDSSSTGATFTLAGTTQITTSQSVFGGASLQFPGASTQNTTSSASPDLKLDGGDWTWDFWVRPTSLAAGWRMFFYQNSPFGLAISQSGSSITVNISTNGTSWNVYNQTIIASNALVLNSWHHIAIVRAGSSLLTFVNGILRSTNPISGTPLGGGSQVVLGASSGGAYFTGQMDEIRYSKGIARWTENFTPPTRPYS